MFAEAQQIVIFRSLPIGHTAGSDIRENVFMNYRNTRRKPIEPVKPRCIMSNDARRALFATMRDHGYVDRWMRLSIASSTLGYIVDSFTLLTDEEAYRIVERFAPPEAH